MDYYEWGKQYLEEAQKLKEHLAPLRGRAQKADHETAAMLYQRIAVLNDMYLDCLHTGNYLIEYGGKRWGENQT